MSTFKIIINTSGGTRAYMNFEAESLGAAIRRMGTATVNAFTGTPGISTVESIEATDEAPTNGLVIVTSGEHEELRDGVIVRREG